MTYIDSKTAKEALSQGDGKGPRFDVPVPDVPVDFVMNDRIRLGFNKDQISCAVVQATKAHPHHFVIEPEGEDPMDPYINEVLADCRNRPKITLWRSLIETVRYWWRQ